MPIVFVGILRCGFVVCLVAGLVCEARVVEFRLPFAFLDCLVCGVGDGGCVRFDVGCLLDVVFGAHDQGDADDECRCGEHGGSHAPSDDVVFCRRAFVSGFAVCGNRHVFPIVGCRLAVVG